MTEPNYNCRSYKKDLSPEIKKYKGNKQQIRENDRANKGTTLLSDCLHHRAM